MLRWRLSGPSERVRKLQDRGWPIPENMLEPDLLPGLGVWFDEFVELSNDRQLGDVVGPIPAASIARSASRLSDDDALLFRKCIRAMDAEYLTWVSDMRKAQEAAGKG